MRETPMLADPERALALVHAPADKRAALATLWSLDERLGAVVATTREPMIGAIRLAWWREALQGKDSEGGPRGEPLLGLIREALQELDGQGLSKLCDGWAVLLEALPLDAGQLTSFAAERGDLLWQLAMRILDDTRAEELANGGGGWALVDLAFRVSDRETAERALAMASERLANVPSRWPRTLRPLGMLVALARRDIRNGLDSPRRIGSPARVGRMLWHRISGI